MNENENNMDNWKRVATFIDDLIPLMGNVEVIKHLIIFFCHQVKLKYLKNGLITKCFIFFSKKEKSDQTGEFVGKSHPHKFGPFNLIEFGRRMMRGITKIRNGFSERQSETFPTSWEGINWRHMIQKIIYDPYFQNQPTQHTQNRQDIVGSLGNLLTGVTQISGFSVCIQKLRL